MSFRPLNRPKGEKHKSGNIIREATYAGTDMGVNCIKSNPIFRTVNLVQVEVISTQKKVKAFKGQGL